jgi:hypothetical protein
MEGLNKYLNYTGSLSLAKHMQTSLTDPESGWLISERCTRPIFILPS